MLSLGFLLATAGTTRAQCPGGGVDLMAVSIDPSALVISPLGTIQLVVEMRNNGPCVIPTGQARFTVTFPDTHIQPAIPLNVTDLCVPARWSLFNQNQAGGFYSLTFRNDAGPIPVGGAACAMTFNIGGKGLLTAAPVPITLTSSLTATATEGDLNGFNQNASTQVSVAAVLPVVLADFNVTASSCNSVLNWRTLSENKVKNFEIQYSSNASSFTTVGTINAKNSANGATYKYVNAQGNGRGFYRVKMVDLDGQVSYSNILSVDTRCNGTKSVSLYPNPLISGQQLSVIVSGYEGSIRGELVSLSGQTVRSYSLKNGTNTLPVDKLAQATYLFRVSDETGATESFRVVIAQ